MHHMTFLQFLESILPILNDGGVAILRNEFGTSELRGADLMVYETDKQITLYHGTAENREHASHFHLKKGVVGFAAVVESEGSTPQLACWRSKDAVSDERPLFTFFFPSFFDWSNGKTLLAERVRYFEDWVTSHGREFELSA